MGRHVIYHHNDLDGRCAAAIMAKWSCQPDKLLFFEVDYKDQIRVDDLEPADIVSVVDFSFKPEIMAEVRRRVSSVVWCDHHVTAKDYGYDDLPGVRDFSDKGLSGCECVWKFCYPDLPIPPVVRYIGDYDAWRLERVPECYQLYEGLKLRDTNPQSALWRVLLGQDTQIRQTLINDILHDGSTAIKYRDNYCMDMAKSYGYSTGISDGTQEHLAYAMNVFRFGSPGFGELMTKYPVCIAYVHDGHKFTVSLYSTTVDVSKIAKHFNGGGHKGAAGFVCTELPFMDAALAAGNLGKEKP